MRRSTRARRIPANLSESISRQLNMYALAATAAGAGTLALSHPVEAKIIYTSAHAKVGHALPVDLNHDGIVDFYLNTWGDSGSHGLSACQYWFKDASSSIFCSAFRGANAIRMIKSNRRTFAAALRYGEKIQGGQRFANPMAVLARAYIATTTPTWTGPWLNEEKASKIATSVSSSRSTGAVTSAGRALQ